jgi:hypothetical protein
LKGSRNFSRQKVGTVDTSQGRFLNLLFSAKKGSMATGLRFEDKIDGEKNFGAWKERMIFLFQENELWDIVENTTTHPVVVPTDSTLLATYTKKSIKAKRFILDAIKNHLIP